MKLAVLAKIFTVLLLTNLSADIAFLDFTYYGAKPIRCYVPDQSGDLVNVIKAPKTVIDCEKQGELAEVWKMTPIRRPGATGLVFELPGGRAVSMKPPQTNGVSAVQSNNRTIPVSPIGLTRRTPGRLRRPCLTRTLSCLPRQ